MVFYESKKRLECFLGENVENSDEIAALLLRRFYFLDDQSVDGANLIDLSNPSNFFIGVDPFRIYRTLKRVGRDKYEKMILNIFVHEMCHSLSDRQLLLILTIL